MTSPSSLSSDALERIGSSISTSVWERVKELSLQDQQLDLLRSSIMERHSTLAEKLIDAETGKASLPFEEKCATIQELQECLYDLQLVEHASRPALVGLAKTVFALDKTRCVRRKKDTSAANKPKPLPKRRRLECSPAQSFGILSRKATDRDQRSPLVGRSDSKASGEILNPLGSSGDHGTIKRLHSSIVSKRKKRSIQDSRLDCYDFDDEGAEDCVSTLVERAKEHKEKAHEEKPTSASTKPMKAPVDPPELTTSSKEPNSSAASQLARKRGGVQATPDIKPEPKMDSQRAQSPRKGARAAPTRRVHNRAVVEDSDDSDEDEVEIIGKPSKDEPTYCLCEQISYGDMICCDNSKCAIEWFHFSCVLLRAKPKGKKWFCPMCRGEKPTVLKSTIATGQGTSSAKK